VIDQWKRLLRFDAQSGGMQLKAQAPQ
jgi:hypothetical protein